MTIKTTFKSHFKIKKNLKKNLDKSIFVKNIVVFFLFSKIFFKSCSVNLLFLKKKKTQTSFLKAPSRHKKFFHQIFSEIFLLKVFFYFNTNNKIKQKNLVVFFERLGGIFGNFGTNTFVKTKFEINVKLNFNNFFLIPLL